MSHRESNIKAIKKLPGLKVSRYVQRTETVIIILNLERTKKELRVTIEKHNDSPSFNQQLPDRKGAINHVANEPIIDIRFDLNRGRFVLET